MKDCTHCKHAAWLRTRSGALHPCGDGMCTWTFVPPKLPASMYFLQKPVPNGGTINRRKELPTDCVYFARVEPPK
jgi:hypothetical protein